MGALRFGIVGTNFISEWFTRACGRTNGIAEATAVLSRRSETGEAFAREHGIGRVFTDLTEMCEAVDAVYIASPNGVHHTQALAAIEAGKHVLVEKVMGTTEAEVRDILDAAEAKGVVAMEATRHLHTPAYELLRETLPQLGTIRQVSFAKCQYSSRYDRFRAGEVPNAFDPGLGNSALADIGVYVLEPAIDLFGAPLAASGASTLLHNGFEGAGSMMLTYPDLVVDLSWSKITQGVTPSVILGEDAALTISDLAEPTLMELHPRKGDTVTLLEGPVAPQDTMPHEVLAFAAQVEAGRTDPRWSRVTLESRRLMDTHLAAHSAP
ncbi:MAG: Gfo/Idh/MocA family oxidoreductase [Dermatophilus congolensis]|nr:Gfo/Idh/MocA family oxidoreductase [Dermatophilus congolensis]